MIYGVLFPEQEREIDAYCFGDCGAGILGAIISNRLGLIVPCRRENCQYEEKITGPVGVSARLREEVRIRFLTPVEDE